jgi:hypothetical protein
MKLYVRTILLFAAFYIPILSDAQQKDSLKLICPLNDATIVPPNRNAMRFDETDLCVVLLSIPDTVVKSVGAGRITNIEYTEESGNGCVLFSRINGKEYYFWFSGMNKLLVKRNDIVKIGQPLGYVSSGDKIELTMYEFETPVDPVQFLKCPKVLRGF